MKIRSNNLMGFPELDIVIGDFQNSNLIVIASRPSAGKTDFVLNILRNAAINQNKNVYLFSLESNTKSVMDRLIASEGKLHKSKVRNALFSSNDWDTVAETFETFSKTNIFIDDTPSLTVRSMVNKINNQVSFSPDLIIVDYLELIEVINGQNRYRIIHQLKNMSKQFKCPVIVTCQLSRNVERMENKRPVLSDLQDFRQIEHTADLILFLHPNNNYPEKKNIIEVIIAKNNKNTLLGSIELVYLKETGIFASLEKSSFTTNP